MDKRVFTRIQVPGAWIQFRKLGKIYSIPALSKQIDINNISKSGLCFETDCPMNYGDPISMKLNFPDGVSLRLKGQIRWNKEVDSTNHYYTGVQFNLFGTHRKYNSISTLEYLRSLNGQGLIKSVSKDDE